MGQSGWRLPDDLLKRVRVRCAESGERQNAFVVRALESALGDYQAVGPASAGSVPRGRAPAPVPTRAPGASTPKELAGLANVAQVSLDAAAEMQRARDERQARLNREKGL